MRGVRRLSVAVVGGLLLLWCPAGYPQDAPQASGAIDPLYRDVASGMYVDQVPANIGPALTVDLGVAGRLVLPPRFAEQEVFAVQRLFYLGPGLEDAVAVGLHARAPNGASQGFALVYALAGRKGILKAELPLREHFLGFEVLTINHEPALAILGVSGVHFHDLWIYRFTQGQPELLLAEGSAAEVDLRPDPATGDPQVWVGVENWADPTWSYASGQRLWNVYAWTGKAFVFSKTLSTTRQTFVDKRTQGYVARVKEGMKNAQQHPQPSKP